MTPQEKLWADWLDHSEMSDAEWRAYRASRDRETFFDLAVKVVCVAIGIIVLLGACGLFDWIAS